MIPRECKRIIEVDFPIAKVSGHAAREKKFPVPRGLPSTLHIWWARRPLAACRAVLLGLLLPDPCDPLCPVEFKTLARKQLLNLRGRPEKWAKLIATDEGLRTVMLQFIGDFANWDNASDASYLEVGRGIVKAAHPEKTPLVVDPFAGGGSIPLEALRLGCEAFASDLNPVACLILRVMLDEIPRHGPELADELRQVGTEIKAAAEIRLNKFYPLEPDGSRPVAYLWARTVRCESPNCGAEIPLVRSFWVSKKEGRKCAIRPVVESTTGSSPIIKLELFEPSTEGEVHRGTVSLAKATCLACKVVLPPDRVRSQLKAQDGGADVLFNAQGQRIGGARLLAVVTTQSGIRGRKYRVSSPVDYLAIHSIAEYLNSSGMGTGQIHTNDFLPNEPTPGDGTGSVGGGYRTRKYGINCFSNFFTARQKLCLASLGAGIQALFSSRQEKHVVIAELLALALDKVIDFNSSFSRWRASNEDIADLFGRQAIPMVWDFVEINPIGEGYVDFTRAVNHVAEVVSHTSRAISKNGEVHIADAASNLAPPKSASVWFTDPPYYDSVPYADLSDFFFVWLKRVLTNHPLLSDPFDNLNQLTPKTREAVRDIQEHLDGRPKKTAKDYEQAMYRAFVAGNRTVLDDGIGCVVFAHKTTEGWEALLAGMIKGGWVITGSWPIATEMGTRLRAQDSAALKTSVHLIVRPRNEDTIGDWGEVARELPRRVKKWMDRLQAEGIRGADLVFACIGPALEVYSRYAKVVDAQDREVPLGGNPESKEPHKRGYLAYVWETVARLALEQVLGGEGRGAGLEEDARLTALFLWTLQSTDAEKVKERSDDESEIESDDEEDDAPKPKRKGYSLIFDVARRFAQPLGIRLDAWEHRIIEIEKGVVRLLPVTERAKQLFGDEGADVVAAEIEAHPGGGAVQLKLFADEETPKVRGRRGKASFGASTDESFATRNEATTLDRVHAAMLLQRAGRTQALRALLSAEKESGSEFERLANALSALYPRDSEEKRLLDAMLLAMPR